MAGSDATPADPQHFVGDGPASRLFHAAAGETFKRVLSLPRIRRTLPPPPLGTDAIGAAAEAVIKAWL